MVHQCVDLFDGHGAGIWCLAALSALEIGDSTEDIGMPVWPIKAAIVLMFLLLSVVLLQTGLWTVDFGSDANANRGSRRRNA